MGKRLVENLNSFYIGAANQLRPKNTRKKIIAYVESCDDVFFWRTLLSEFENEKYCFQVMLPSSHSLAKGKKNSPDEYIGLFVGSEYDCVCRQ